MSKKEVRPFYADRLEEAETYWKKQQITIKESRQFLEAIVFNLTSLQEAPIPKLSYHSPKANKYAQFYQQSLQKTTTLLQQLSDSLNPILSIANDTLTSFPNTKETLRDNKKYHTIQLSILYKQHAYLNSKLFCSMQLFNDAFRMFFEKGKNVWVTKIQIIFNETKLYKSIESSQFISYYGIPLEQILAMEGRTTKQLPKKVEELITNVLSYGTNCKGVFRHSPYASLKDIEETTKRLSVTVINEYTSDFVACVLKYYLQGLPVHIFDTLSTLEMFQIHLRTVDATPEILCKKYKQIINNMNEAYITLFQNMLYLCYNIQLNAEVNSMNAKNLSIVLAPTLFTLPKPEMFTGSSIDPNTSKEVSYAIDILTFFISHFHLIFNDIEQSGRQLVSVQEVDQDFLSLSISPRSTPKKQKMQLPMSSVIKSSLGNSQHPLVTTRKREKRNQTITKLSFKLESKDSGSQLTKSSQSNQNSTRRRRTVEQNSLQRSCIEIHSPTINCLDNQSPSNYSPIIPNDENCISPSLEQKIDIPSINTIKQDSIDVETSKNESTSVKPEQQPESDITVKSDSEKKESLLDELPITEQMLTEPITDNETNKQSVTEKVVFESSLSDISDEQNNGLTQDSPPKASQRKTLTKLPVSYINSSLASIQNNKTELVTGTPDERSNSPEKGSSVK
ncbi:Rho-GAP domain-containing protein [Entamoeba marina]